MPKLPTQRARDAHTKLLDLLANTVSSESLPTVRELGEQLDLSYSTVSRLLQEFVKKGHAWQHPNGRFFPAAAGTQAAAGLPIVIVGRQIQNWSRLYQEILEGVSEVCTAKGCPLIFHSSNKLVRHTSLEHPPVFATLETQAAELGRIAASLPRLCAGILFDHLWDEDLLLAAPFPSAPRLLLARPSHQSHLLSSAPDFAKGAQELLRHLAQARIEKIYLAIPFKGDQAVDAAGDALIAEADHLQRKVITLDCSTPAKRGAAITRLASLKTPTALVCTEDNVTSLLNQSLVMAGLDQSDDFVLASMQGTGAIDLPICRLRYDYRQLGRNAVMAVIERRKTSILMSPTVTVCLASPR